MSRLFALAVGSYCTNPASSTPCLPGTYCPEGSPLWKICPAKTYCQTPSTNAPCPIGSYCYEALTNPIPCATMSICRCDGGCAQPQFALQATIATAVVFFCGIMYIVLRVLGARDRCLHYCKERKSQAIVEWDNVESNSKSQEARRPADAPGRLPFRSSVRNIAALPAGGIPTSHALDVEMPPIVSPNPSPIVSPNPLRSAESPVSFGQATRRPSNSPEPKGSRSYRSSIRLAEGVLLSTSDAPATSRDRFRMSIQFNDLSLTVTDSSKSTKTVWCRIVCVRDVKHVFSWRATNLR